MPLLRPSKLLTKMRAKVPHLIKLGGQTVDLIYKKRVLSIVDGKETLAGQCLPAFNKIEICLTDNNTRDLLLKTIWHETIHYALYVSGQEVVIANKDPELEEGIVQTLEISLFKAVNWKSKMWGKWSMETINKPKDKHASV